MMRSLSSELSGGGGNSNNGSLWQSLPFLRSARQRHQVWQVAVALCLGVLYLNVFFFHQPNRTRGRLDAWATAVKQQQAEEQESRLRTFQDGQQGLTNEISDGNPLENASSQQQQQQSTTTANHVFSNLLDWLLLWMAFSVLFRVYLQHCIYPRLSRARASRLHQDLRNRRQRFRQWVTRLNRQREYNGQRPLSMESLSLVLRDRELNGEDYDGLLQFDEEAGPAMEALLNSVGATPQEIERCPLRVLQPTDDLLVLNRSNAAALGSGSACPICLEPFVVNDTVRTIPCFHAFHKDCIDPWLAQKAICPVCKHNAIA